MEVEVTSTRIESSETLKNVLEILIVMECKNDLILKRILSTTYEPHFFRIWCDCYAKLVKTPRSKKTLLKVSRLVLEKVTNSLQEPSLSNLIKSFAAGLETIDSSESGEIVLEFRADHFKQTKFLKLPPVTEKLLQKIHHSLKTTTSINIYEVLKDFLEVVLINLSCESWYIGKHAHKVTRITFNLFEKYPALFIKEVNISLIPLVTHLMEREFFVMCQMSWDLVGNYFNLAWFTTFYRNINIRRLSFESEVAFYWANNISEAKKLFRIIRKVLTTLKYSVIDGFVVFDKRNAWEYADLPLFKHVFVDIDSNNEEYFLKLYGSYGMESLIGKCIFKRTISL